MTLSDAESNDIGWNTEAARCEFLISTAVALGN
jgi:hypothetical protein